MASYSQARYTRLTRRQMLAGMSALGAVAALAACGGNSTAPTATSGAQGTTAPKIVGTPNPTAIPQVGATAAAPVAAAAAQPTTGAASAAAPAVAGAKGGTIKFPLGSDGPLNPIVVPGNLASIFTNKTVFNGLIRFNSKTLNPEGDLAEKWEVAPDGKSITFTLRQGVKWHDGQPFTADDVKFTFDTMLDPKINARFRSNIKGVTEAVVNSPLSVTLKLTTPLPSLPIQLGYNIHMIPKHVLQGQDINAPKDFLAKPIGTGPFKFVEATPGSTMTVERYDNFHFGAPQLDRITFKVTPDINAQLAQLKTGELDFMLMEPDQAATVKSDTNIVIQNASQVNYYFIAYNDKRPLFSDKLVRQALTMAIDREAIVKDVLGGAGQIANGPINPLLAWAYTDEVKKLSYDPKAAAAQLDAAGWKAGSDGIRAKDGQKFSFE
ncbi:MAG: ABC transporter substrate-binding protein, partial [Thermomicrobia bacterium]|nr:ABC transporter substrate-binding protein [Thermomicrobia bacterium]